MKQKRSSPQKRKRCATEQRSARNSLRDKRLKPIVELEKQYEALCRLREQVQISESRQRVVLRKSDDAGR